MSNSWKMFLSLGMALLLLVGGAVPLGETAAGTAGVSSAEDIANGGTEDTVTISREEYEYYQQLKQVAGLMDAVNQYYYKEPAQQDMLDGACAGLLAGLGDPYTFYYTPKAWKQMWEEDEGEYAGVGILISSNYKTGLCTISRVFKGSPAEAAGVQRKDILYRVGEDLYVTPETLQEAVDIMRGTPGEPVDVTFLRDGEELTFTLVRAEITVNQVESTMLSDDIGLIALYQFAGQCDEEFDKALNDLIAHGARGLILDLRDNPGGWVDAGQRIADLFVDKGDLCYLVYRDGSEDHCYLTHDGKVDMSLVILVNEETASSSEILSAALRERAGATLVGVKTYGKGVVQAVLPMMSGEEEAGFQITVAEYLTPEGNHVHETGLTPDVEVPLAEDDIGGYDFADTEKDPQLKKAIEVMQEKLK